MIYSFEGIIPVVHPSAFVHPQAVVTGHVIIGKNVYIGPGAALRGDWGKIEIADGCNVQENCTIHMFPGLDVSLENNAHIGHGAIIHGAYIEADVLIGMNSVLMDRARIGKESIVGALAFVAAEMTVPARSIVVGNPAKVVKQVSDEMLEWKKAGTKLYQSLPEKCRNSLVQIEPLSKIPADTPQQKAEYIPWKSRHK